MDPEGSLPHSQEPATCPYPEPDRSSPCLPSYFFKINFSIILTFALGSSKWSPLRFPTKTLYASLFSPIRANVLPISFFFTWSPEWCLVARVVQKLEIHFRYIYENFAWIHVQPDLQLVARRLNAASWPLHVAALDFYQNNFYIISWPIWSSRAVGPDHLTAAAVVWLPSGVTEWSFYHR